VDATAKRFSNPQSAIRNPFRVPRPALPCRNPTARLRLKQKEKFPRRYPLCANIMSKTRSRAMEYVEPIGMRVVVRKDEPKRQTKGGIALPDQSEIPTITGRIVTVSAQVENDEHLPLRQYDKVLFHPKNAIPVDFEPDNQLFVVPVEDIVAVFRRDPREATAKEE
jgi:chaperonin GroES